LGAWIPRAGLRADDYLFPEPASGLIQSLRVSHHPLEASRNGRQDG